MTDEIMLAIGRLEGRMEGVQQAVESQSEKIDSIDTRLRRQETSAAAYGGTAGAIISSLIIGIKMLVSTNGS